MRVAPHLKSIHVAHWLSLEIRTKYEIMLKIEKETVYHLIVKVAEEQSWGVVLYCGEKHFWYFCYCAFLTKIPKIIFFTEIQDYSLPLVFCNFNN